MQEPKEMASRPMQVIPLEDGLIQIWAARLNCSAAELSSLEAVLSTDERARAAKYVFTRDRQAYMAARGILRSILASYVGLPPDLLVFETNCYGKPSLNAASGGERIHFNVAHSGSLALYAVRTGGEVGVDIEQVRPLADLQAIAASTFSKAENLDLQSLPRHQYQEAFFTCWTRKEAFIKAVGQGLSYGLQNFDVTLRPGEQARFRHIAGFEPQMWSLFDLRPAAGYAAAVAVPAPESRVEVGWWNPVKVLG
jgi:4'-phosphopantetheinyl transferase